MQGRDRVEPAAGPRVLVVQHEEDDPAHLFGDWLVDAGASLHVVRAWEGEPVPATLDDVDAVLVMGGAMGAHDDAEHGWLGDVKTLVRRAATDTVPLLGICLGHQLAAVALGGEVAPNPLGKQVGLLSVGWTDAADDDPLLACVATPRRAVQWNDDVVTRLPESAVLLAATDGGEVQAARFAPVVWGVQWHPELDAPLLSRWADDGPLPDGSDATRHVADVAAAAAELETAWRPLADQFVRLVTEAAGARHGT